jgi:transcriptional regulator with XRE-family HTH domain
MHGTGNDKRFANTNLVALLQRRLVEIRPKTQAQVAKEAGFKTPNIITMLKTGESALPLDRVPAMAKALDLDASYLLRLTLDQHGLPWWPILEQACGLIVTANEAAIVRAIRELSGDGDPALTTRLHRQLREIFAK